MDYLILIMIAGLGGWTEWRFHQLGRRLDIPALVNTSEPPIRAEPFFPCYYCGLAYSTTQRERIGQYDYCPEHGAKRKSAWLSLYTKEQPNDDRVGLRPTNRGSEQSNNDKLPWVS